MPDAFPDTPRSLLFQLEKGSGSAFYQSAWREFFDLYHHALRVAALDTFRRFHWTHVPEEILEEVIADVVISFFKADFSYDPERGRFRNYLRQLTTWRIMDRLGKLPKPTEPLDPFLHDDAEGHPQKLPEELLDSRQPGDAMDVQEQDAFRAALFATMLEDVRSQVDPQTFLIFEMTKIQGVKPEAVAEKFKVKRNVVDNAVHRVFRRLQALACQPEYRKEYQL